MNLLAVIYCNCMGLETLINTFPAFLALIVLRYELFNWALVIARSINNINCSDNSSASYKYAFTGKLWMCFGVKFLILCKHSVWKCLLRSTHPLPWIFLLLNHSSEIWKITSIRSFELSAFASTNRIKEFLWRSS